MKQKSHQSGRSLAEILAVLAVIGILSMSTVMGYGFMVKKQREKATAKQVSELVVRYKAHPVLPNENGTVNIKAVFPEATRASTVAIKTPDTDEGRITLRTTAENTSAFAVVVNDITVGSCREIFESGSYENVLWNPSGAEYDPNKKDYVVLGKNLIKNWDTLSNAEKSDEKYNGLRGNTKDQIVSTICADKGFGRIGTAALVIDPGCSDVAAYWYGGVCHPCRESMYEDRGGTCCPHALDACGYCEGCPNGKKCNPDDGKCVECLEDGDCRPGKCDDKTHTCKDCINPGGRCQTTTGENGYCTSHESCEPCDETGDIFRWNSTAEICECAGSFGHNHACSTSYGETNGCCNRDKDLSCQDGVCDCSGGKTWNDDLGKCTQCTTPDNCGGAACTPTGDCCPADKPVLVDGICCVAGEVNADGNCCPADKPHWKEGVGCVECTVNDHCDTPDFCNTSENSYQCQPCTTSTDANASRLVHVPGDTDRCECTDNFRVFCGSTTATMNCIFGGSAVTCKPGCTQHPDCDENYRCSCLGTGCPAAGGTCEPCPADKPLRPKTSSEDCHAGLTCDCDLKDENCPVACCKGCDYKNDPEHCPPSKCCDPATHDDCSDTPPLDCNCSLKDESCPSQCCKGCDYEADPENCPPEKCKPACDPEKDPCCADPAKCCNAEACEIYDPEKGCISMCSKSQACVTYNGGINTCGESRCIEVLPKDKLIIKKGILNDRIFYIPPSESKYRMTHASADRFCAHYGMRLAGVMEACAKDFRYDSGHDCSNFAAYNKATGQYTYTFTDRGNTYNLSSWNTSSSGDFWLAERDGNNALRITHSCGNNHETQVCANMYPLCTE